MKRIRDSIFDSKKQSCKHILNKEHKMTVIKYVDSNPSAAIADITKHLMNEFRLNNLKVSRSTVYNFMRTECNLSLEKTEFHSIERNSLDKINERHDRVRGWDEIYMNFLTIRVFLNELPSHINMKRTRARSTVGTPAVVTMPTTRAKDTAVLGAISASGLIKVSMRIPSSSKRRKAGQESGFLSTETVTGHYISFSKETLD